MKLAMDIRRISKNFREVGVVLGDFLLGKYPSFVYRNRLNKKEIPCFCFHDAVLDEIEPMLRYLVDNNYRTLTLTEFEQAVYGEGSLREKEVFLTFDDGMRSIWSILYPLLKKYDLRATVFIIPGRIKNRSNYLPNLEDVWENRANLQSLHSAAEDEEPLATWEEIQEMQGSGLIDFDSHTLDHSLVFTSAEIVDFVNPDSLRKFHAFEFPRIRMSADEVIDVNRLGAPLYRSAPRVLGLHRYKDPNVLRETCIEHVERNGGMGFFERDGWRDELLDIVKSSTPYRSGQAEYETDEERREAIRFEIAEAKRLIEVNLPGKRSTHLCYPWGIGSNLSCEISRELGYVMSYWTHPEQNRCKIVVKQNPFYIDRLGPDYFYLLPGEGRRSLAGVIMQKIKRRLTSGSPYLTH